MKTFAKPHVLPWLHMLLMWAAVHGRKTDYTDAEVQTLLDLHNAYRARVEPPAANMLKLEWHNELASMAQDWADQCTFEHGQPDWDDPPFDDIGQNLNKFTSSDTVRLDSLHSRTYIPLKTWWDEVSWYNFSSGHCSGPICGHYTQLVWARTRYLGCGYLNGSRCPGQFTYVVCNYGPTGNKGLQPKQPYLRGERCSKCDSGQGWCEHGLCNMKCPFIIKATVQLHYCSLSRKTCSKWLQDCTSLINCHGQDCACPLRCKNCGTLNAKTCTCACTEGWDYADCSEACENSNETFCTRMHHANCALIQTEWCRAKCGHCNYFTNGPKRGTCCGGKMCHNKGYLDSDRCDCICQSGYFGNYCEISSGHRLASSWILILFSFTLTTITSSRKRKYLL